MKGTAEQTDLYQRTHFELRVIAKIVLTQLRSYRYRPCWFPQVGLLVPKAFEMRGQRRNFAH